MGGEGGWQGGFSRRVALLACFSPARAYRANDKHRSVRDELLCDDALFQRLAGVEQQFEIGIV